jgi:hypothetical protein
LWYFFLGIKLIYLDSKFHQESFEIYEPELNKRDICTKFILLLIIKAGCDLQKQVLGKCLLLKSLFKSRHIAELKEVG